MLKSDMDSMFKFDEELFEDDWNDGDYINVKNKSERNGNEFEIETKVSEANENGHDVEVTAGAKFNCPIENYDSQCEVKHSSKEGTEFDCVSKLDGVSYIFKSF